MESIGGRYDTYLRFNIEYTSPALIKDVLDGGFACTVVVAREFCGLDKGVLGTEFEEGFFVGEVVGLSVLFALAGGAGCVCAGVWWFCCVCCKVKGGRGSWCEWVDEFF